MSGLRKGLGRSGLGINVTSADRDDGKYAIPQIDRFCDQTRIGFANRFR